MTDAPNSVSEFGWRKPHPRCTPPWAGLFPFFCRGRGLRPAPWPSLLRQFLLVLGYLSDRVGADLCVRPDTPLCGIRPRADTWVGPYKTSISPNRAGTEPRPYEGPGVPDPVGAAGDTCPSIDTKQRDVSRETSRCPADPPWMQGLGLYAGPGGEGAVIAPLPSAGRLLSRGGTGRSGPPRRRSADPSADPGPPGPPRGGSELPRRPLC